MKKHEEQLMRTLTTALDDYYKKQLSERIKSGLRRKKLSTLRVKNCQVK